MYSLATYILYMHGLKAIIIIIVSDVNSTHLYVSDNQLLPLVVGFFGNNWLFSLFSLHSYSI